jgi:hypothetical protein
LALALAIRTTVFRNLTVGAAEPFISLVGH